MSKTEVVNVEVHLHRQTEKAYHVSLDGDDDKAEWVPKSQCQLEDSEDGRTKKLAIPEWLALKKGFI